MGGCEAATPVPVEPQVKYHPGAIRYLTAVRESGLRTVSEGQFDWGGFLLNCNGGARRYTQHGWQSCVERKGRSVLGPSDPAMECGIVVAQRIKGTLGITG